MKPILLALLTLTASCSTPYKEFGTEFWSGFGGYTEDKIGQDKYLVRYYGNNVTGQAEIQKMAYRRVRELCSDYEILATEARQQGTVPIFETKVICR
jgi:hypothetical protein